jgi:HEAT repeat protein
MSTVEQDAEVMRVLEGLTGDSSVRLKAVMAMGTSPDPRYVDRLIERCAVEPDFYVRDMLTWALTRHPAEITVPRLVAELRSRVAQARSQALHTLSKIGDRRAWPAITRELLTDGDDEVARAAWRAAVVLVPENERAGLGAVLVTLGEAVVPMLRAAAEGADEEVRAHAIATERLMRDPETGFEYALEEAKRVVALGPDGEPGRQEE